MRGFFSYFPTLNYANTLVTNVLAKVRFQESVAKNLATFRIYDIKEGERADQIASYFYNDPYKDWVIYLSNMTLDPYHEWPKAQSALYEFIEAKYGSIANSQAQIVFWRNNYYADDTVLEVPAYSALSAAQKFFWAPISGFDGTTVGYERKRADITVETNQSVIAAGVFATPAVGTKVTQGAASGTVAAANSSQCTLQHVTGAFAPGNSSIGTITSATVIADNFAPGAAAYFTAITAFEYEEELNEARKNIRLLQPQYVDLVERDLKDLLSA